LQSHTLLKLPVAQGIAAALFILGFIDRSMNTLEPFKWGPTFYQLNEKALKIYANSINIRDAEIYIKAKIYVQSNPCNVSFIGGTFD